MKLYASAAVKRADSMLAMTSSVNPSDPSLRAAWEKNSSSSYNLEITTRMILTWQWQSTSAEVPLLTVLRRRSSTRRFRRELMPGWRQPARHLSIFMIIWWRHIFSQFLPSTTVAVDCRAIQCCSSSILMRSIVSNRSPVIVHSLSDLVQLMTYSPVDFLIMNLYDTS